MEADKHALIDEFASAYDMVERHQTDVHAPVDRVYDAVRNLDLTGSRTIRWLFLLRELPASLRLVGRGYKRLGLTLDARPGGSFLGAFGRHPVVRRGRFQRLLKLRVRQGHLEFHFV